MIVQPDYQTALYYFFSTLAQVSVGVIGALFIFYQVFHSLMSSQIRKSIRQMMANCFKELKFSTDFLEYTLNLSPHEALTAAGQVIAQLENSRLVSQNSLLEKLYSQKKRLVFELHWESFFMKASLFVSGFWVLVALGATIPILFIPEGWWILGIFSFKNTIAIVLFFAGLVSISLVCLAFFHEFFLKLKMKYQK